MRKWVLTVIACGLFASALHAADWSHVLPTDLYKDLTLPQRDQVDKALRLYDKGGEGKDRKRRMYHKNAANDWERFRTRHGDVVDPAVFAYSLFMQAMSQRHAGDRHTAVKTFTEVLDFFPDEIWLAAPALYFRARTHFDIGDAGKGYVDFKDMLADEDYAKHPLAGDAYLELADNHWQHKRTGKALDMWKVLVRDFRESNDSAARKAEYKLRDWMLVNGEIEETFAWYLDRRDRGSEAEQKASAAKSVYRKAMKEFDRGYWKWYFEPVLGEKRGARKRDELKEAVRAWFFAKESWFAEADRLWDFMMLRFDDIRRHDPDKLGEFIPSLSSYLRSNPGEQQAKRADQLVNKLAGVGEYELAFSLLEFYPTPVDRLWKRFDLETRRKRYEEADGILGELLEVKDAKVISRARRERASLYHKRMGKYEEAIKLYYEINDPPGTLWSIVDCQRKLGQKDRAQNTLTEIASIFPDQASKAIFRKAEFFRRDGEKKMAIGLYRNLLSHPEWKKSGESSKAHDRLEDMDIDTGGAVIHEVN